MIDQDQLSAQVAAPDWQQQVAHWTAVQQAQLGRDQQKLQKKSHELEDMLEKIRQVGLNMYAIALLPRRFRCTEIAATAVRHGQPCRTFTFD